MKAPIILDSAEKIKSLIDSVDTILVDCDGVIYLNNQLIKGTNDVLNKLQQSGKRVIFASNNSSKSRRYLLHKLHTLGFHCTIDQVYGSSFVAARYLADRNFKGTVYVMGCDGIKDELDALHIKNFGVGPDPNPTDGHEHLIPPNISKEVSGHYDAVICGFDNLVSLPKLIKACTFASRVDPDLFIATNDDETFPTPDPKLLVPGTGCFINFVSTAVGRKPVVMGKPNASYFDVIRSMDKQINPDRTLMVGDRLNTDIALGRVNGLGYTLLVETGVHTRKDVDHILRHPHQRGHHTLTNDHLIPSHVIKSLADLNIK